MRYSFPGMKENTLIPHIEGLRGIAIILVFLFHLNSAVWGHGYLGVDMFLVLMGFLMLRPWKNSLDEQSAYRASWDYFLRRVRRIVPPMLVVILLTVLLGILLIYANDEYTTCQNGAAAAVMGANIFLENALADYFAPDSAFMPLLHLWYLSVVLQISLLYAVGRCITHHLSHKTAVLIAILAGVLSFSLAYREQIVELFQWMGCPLWQEGLKAPSYYATFPRIWEVLAGGVVFYLPELKHRRTLASILCLAGLVLILIPALCDMIPGMACVAKLPTTLLCVMGTVLVIRYGSFSPLNALLTNKPITWLGGISFSIYLVHMPIIVLWRLWVLGHVGVADEIGIGMLSLVMGWLFWKYVESRRMRWWLILLFWGCTLLLCLRGIQKEGFTQWMTLQERHLTAKPKYEKWHLCQDVDLCSTLPKSLTPTRHFFMLSGQKKEVTAQFLETPLLAFGNPDIPPSILLIGDSHAAAFYAGFDTVFRETPYSGVYLSTYVKPFHVEGDKKEGEDEKALLQWIRQNKKIRHVIISQHWMQRFNAADARELPAQLRAFLQELVDLHVQVTLIASTPIFEHVAHYKKIYSVRGMKLPGIVTTCTPEDYLKQTASSLPILKQMANEGLCHLVEPLKILAPGEAFHSIQGDQLLMCDRDHMNVIFSQMMTRRLLPQLLSILEAESPTPQPIHQ